MPGFVGGRTGGWADALEGRIKAGIRQANKRAIPNEARGFVIGKSYVCPDRFQASKPKTQGGLDPLRQFGNGRGWNVGAAVGSDGQGKTQRLTAETLQKHHERGVNIAFDDFGTGYASLSYLTRFPLSRIKIDRSFIQTMTTDPESASIVNALAGLGRGLGLTVAAEGIDGIEQETLLLGSGCNIGQATLFREPIDAGAALALFPERSDVLQVG